MVDENGQFLKSTDGTLLESSVVHEGETVHNNFASEILHNEEELQNDRVLQTGNVLQNSIVIDSDNQLRIDLGPQPEKVNQMTPRSQILKLVSRKVLDLIIRIISVVVIQMCY